MKRGNIEHWKADKLNSNLLIFSQLVNELLFDYSIPSNKISTLNSHYLCYDAMLTITDIEEKGVPEGTLKPIAEEFYDVLSKDIVFQIKNEQPLKFFIKRTPQRYVEAKPNELNYQELKLIISAIHNKYFKDDWYFNSLKKEIADRVKTSDSKEWQNLFKLTKIFLTELVNGGYDPRYIYETLHAHFFNKKTTDYKINIDSFLDTFNFSESDYTVIIKAPVTMERVLSFSKSFKVVKQNALKGKNGNAFFNSKKCEIFYSLTVKSYDKYRAVSLAKRKIERLLSQYKLFDHKFDIESTSLFYAVKSDMLKLCTVDSPVGAVLKKGTLSNERIVKKMENCQKITSNLSKEGNFHDLHTFNKALILHSRSIESDSEENQLLDLWSIFETVIDINNKHTSDRIQQICFMLIPILKRRYIYSLFEQLANDVYLYSSELFKDITGMSQVNDESISELCAFVLVDSYKDKREELLQKIKLFPLMQERIIYYNEMLSTKEKCARFVEKHLNRIKWQIMRIYRNRNLIIHNGERMPYLALLIENLHYYVDDFIEYIIEAFSKDLTLYNMELDLFIQEQDWLKYFNNKKERILKEDIVRILSY